ncbi:MAG: hypothetical protein DPW18_20135 [Chloroflexi bacterium]|nr:MAG: hypothetical protein EDM79_18265 [Chloroflexota bacterium]MCQ3939329.1 hypothetical protein [Chloroflexota bacterium]MDL1940729.1 hypothetical protein [Chloroflexi bacterium CFX2]
MMKNRLNWFFVGVLIVLLAQGCNLPGPTPAVEATIPPTQAPPTVPQTSAPTAIQHQAIPISAPDSNPYPDVTSSDTASEKRAPYGDSYDINRLERPFTQDMIYIPDMDISSFSISEEGDWYYVSIGLVGKNPNNPPGIQYALELDTNLDSFGDFLIVAAPPYSEEWTADNVRVYTDTNRDSAGASAARSDAPFSGDGYDQLIHSLADGIGNDVDLAWVRINASQFAAVQFAFKKSLSGSSFLYSVIADAGLKDVARLDYVDYFTLSNAGSPVRDNPNYPLKELYAVDNTCYQAFGFKPTGFEPKICPEIVQPQNAREPGEPPPSTPGVDACTAIGQPNPGNCPWGWSDWPYCVCTPG